MLIGRLGVPWSSYTLLKSFALAAAPLVQAGWCIAYLALSQGLDPVGSSIQGYGCNQGKRPGPRGVISCKGVSRRFCQE